MLLEVCVNGPRLPDEHPRLVATPENVAAEARAAVTAGARAIHLHPKTGQGHDSLAGADVDRYVAAARAACPRIPVGVTTGAWSAPSTAERLAAIDSWTVLPDFASVNWHEEGADQAAARLLERGVEVEAGIWHAEGLARWQASPHRLRCLRVLVELPDLARSDRIATIARELVESVRTVAPGLPILLHGEDRSAWPALDLAARWGLDTRIGLEDTLFLPDGEQARGNDELVAAAVARLHGHGQEPPVTDELSANEPLDTDTGPGLRGIGLVALGGAVGTLARHVLDTLIGDAAGLPLGIFVINITGAFLLGVLIEGLALRGPDRGRRRELRLLLGTGVLGGYTTYSLLATDIAQLVDAARVWEAIGYGVATIVIGALASWTGVLTARGRRARS